MTSSHAPGLAWTRALPRCSKRTSVNDEATSAAVAERGARDVEIDAVGRPRRVVLAEQEVRREERREQHDVGGEEHDDAELGGGDLLPRNRAGELTIRWLSQLRSSTGV